MEQTIQNIKSILLIVGALGMILGVLLIINIKNKGELAFIDQWKEKCNILSYKSVLIYVSSFITLYGGAEVLPARQLQIPEYSSAYRRLLK